MRGVAEQGMDVWLIWKRRKFRLTFTKQRECLMLRPQFWPSSFPRSSKVRECLTIEEKQTRSYHADGKPQGTSHKTRNHCKRDNWRENRNSKVYVQMQLVHQKQQNRHNTLQMWQKAWWAARTSRGGTCRMTIERWGRYEHPFFSEANILGSELLNFEK